MAASLTPSPQRSLPQPAMPLPAPPVIESGTPPPSRGVTAIGWLYVVYGVVCFWVALWCLWWAFLSPMIGIILALFFVSIGLYPILLARSLWRYRRWTWYAVVIFGGLNIIGFLWGVWDAIMSARPVTWQIANLAINAIILYYMICRHVRMRFFKNNAYPLAESSFLVPRPSGETVTVHRQSPTVRAAMVSGILLLPWGFLFFTPRFGRKEILFLLANVLLCSVAIGVVAVWSRCSRTPWSWYRVTLVTCVVIFFFPVLGMMGWVLIVAAARHY